MVKCKKIGMLVSKNPLVVAEAHLMIYSDKKNKDRNISFRKL